MSELKTLRPLSAHRPSRGKGPREVEIRKDIFGLPMRQASMAEILDWIDYGSTVKEIAGTLRCSVDTVERYLLEATGMNYTQIREQACGRSMINLRRNQFKLAKTSAPMAIWLGQQYLGQSTTSSLQVTVEPEARQLLAAWEASLMPVEDESTEPEGREDIQPKRGRPPKDKKGEG